MTEKIRNRKSIVKELIAAGNVQSQEELASLLEDRGFAVTQATLSRDLKELGVAKVYDRHFGYCYRLATSESGVNNTFRESTTSDGILSIEFCGQMVVLKTVPGFAGAVASVVDRNLKSEFAGTIAGDDTIFAVIRGSHTQHQIVTSLEKFLPGSELKVR